MRRIHQLRVHRVSFAPKVVAAVAALGLSMMSSGSLAQNQGSPESGQSAQEDRQQPRGDRPDRGRTGGDRGDRANRGDRGQRDDRGNRGGRGGRMGRGGPDRGGPDRGGPDRGGPGGEGPRRGPDGPARGMGLMGTPDDLFSPDYMTRDVPEIVEDLQLDDTQRAIVVQLFEDYDETFRSMVDGLRDQTESLTEAYVPDPQLEEDMEQLRDSMRSLREEAREARRSFQGGRQGRNGGPEDFEEIQDPIDEERDQPETQEERQARAEAMREEFRMLFDDMNQQMRSVREKQLATTAMQELMDSRVALIREFAREKKQLRESTENGVRALLIEEQSTLWDDLAKKIRRKRLMPRGRLSGESTDLLEILEQMNLETDAVNEEVSMLAKNYALELDAALVARDAFDYAEGLDLMDHLRNQDAASSLSVLRKRLTLREMTRDVNDRYIEAISLVLSSPESDDFRLQSLRRGYSGIYRPTRGERAMVAAMEIEDLEPELLAAVADLMQRHGDEIASFNEDMLIVLRNEDSSRELRRAEGRINRFRGQRSDPNAEAIDPVREAMEDRNEIDERYLASLEDLLGPDRFESVAGRRNRGRGEGRNRGQGGFSRDEIVAQFDKNGDGELDEEERRAAREAMRERFRGGQRGAGRGSGPREL